LSGLVQQGTIPNKNFNQIDVISLGRRLSAKQDREGAKKLFEALIAATVSAVATVSKSLPESVPDSDSTLRIFFPFMGASCKANPNLLKNRVNAKCMYMPW
jgi:hypothetical protein